MPAATSLAPPWRAPELHTVHPTMTPLQPLPVRAHHLARRRGGQLATAAAAAGLAAAALALLPHPARAQEAPPPTVSSVDLARYAGSWYEISRLPNRFQKQCVSDTQAEYRLEKETVRVINRCRTADGKVDEIKGRAKVVPDSGNARLRVTFFWPIYGDYWVLALADDYSEALVGSPDRRYAWVLARTPQLPQARLDALMQRAKTLGFDTAAFVATPQTSPLPAGAAAPAVAAASAASAP